MSELALNSNTLTMTSREIAELVESRHDSVKRAIERLATPQLNDDGSVKKPATITLPPLVDKPSTGGRPSPEYIFSGEQGKRDTYVVVAQLSPEFTASLVDRWQELETKAAVSLPDFNNPAVAARAWADQVEKSQQAQQEVQRLQGVCETIASQFVPGMTPPDFARLLNGVNTKALQTWMVNQGMLMVAHKGYKATSYYRDRYLTQRVTEAGELPGRPYVVLTTIGAKLIYKKYLKGELPMKKTWDGKFTHDIFMEQAA